jgi:hypothetical protein
VYKRQGPYYRNFTLGQDGSDLILRLRTLGTDGNGTKPHFTLPNFFTDTKAHRLVIKYGGANLSFYVDRPNQVYIFDVPTNFISGGPEIFIIYHSLIVRIQAGEPGIREGINCLPLQGQVINDRLKKSKAERPCARQV